MADIDHKKIGAVQPAWSERGKWPVDEDNPLAHEYSDSEHRDKSNVHK